MTRLKEKYQKEVVPALTKEFGYKNPMQVPRVEKVVVNMGSKLAVGAHKVVVKYVGDGYTTASKKALTFKPNDALSFNNLGAAYFAPYSSASVSSSREFASMRPLPASSA